MGEFLSFILFIAAMAAFFYLLFFIILPSIIIYLGGISMVMVAVAYLIRREKNEARFIPKPVSSHTVRLIILFSFILPVVHAGFLWPFHTKTWVLVVFLLNLLLAMAWLLTFLVRSRRAKKIYQSTGGENRLLLDTLIAHKEALKIRSDALKCILDRPTGLEPWEAAVLGNDEINHDINRGEVEKMLSQIETMGRKIDELLSACEAVEQHAGPEGLEIAEVYEKSRRDLNNMEKNYKLLMDKTAVIISQNEL